MVLRLGYTSNWHTNLASRNQGKTLRSWRALRFPGRWAWWVPEAWGWYHGSWLQLPLLDFQNQWLVVCLMKIGSQCLLWNSAYNFHLLFMCVVREVGLCLVTLTVYLAFNWHNFVHALNGGYQRCCLWQKLLYILLYLSSSSKRILSHQYDSLASDIISSANCYLATKHRAQDTTHIVVLAEFELCSGFGKKIPPC